MSYYYYQDAIDPQICRDLIENFDHENAEQADVGMWQGRGALFADEIRRYKEEGLWDYEADRPKKGVLAKIRETKLNWLEPAHPMNKVLLDYVLETNKKVWHYNLSKQTPCQLGKYEVGSFFTWHQDGGYSYMETEVETRKLTAMMMVSAPGDFEGGEFEFYVGDSPYVRPPVSSQGSILVFDSHIWHRVKPVTKGVRYSLVSFIVGPAFV